MSEPFLTCYLSRIVDLPPMVAQAAFDAQFISEGVRPCGLAAIGCRLELLGHTGGRRTPPAGLYRVLPGTLHAGLRRTRVDLELAPWSSRRVEVGLAPRVRGRRPLSEPLVAAGHEVLVQLDSLLQAWADAPLARLGNRTRSSPESGGAAADATGIGWTAGAKVHGNGRVRRERVLVALERRRVRRVRHR